MNALRIALVAGLAAVATVTPARAFDSGCSVGGPSGAACEAGPGSARNPWQQAQIDEHRRIWELTVQQAGLPSSVSAAGHLALRTFTGQAGEGGAEQPITIGGQPAASIAPVDFRNALHAQDRPPPDTVGEFAQLPDFSYALWDWALGNETCPLDAAGAPTLDGATCHDFALHMGPVNSNHFPPQSQDYWAHYHGLAVERAKACNATAQRLGPARGRFRDYLRECEQEALVFEAIAHHFLQDAWSMGHMWQRWGSSELGDYGGDKAAAVLIGAITGMIHGSRSLLQSQASHVGGDVDDPMCAPGPEIAWKSGVDAAPLPGAGDEYLERILGDDAFTPQRDAMLRCTVSSLREVYDQLSAPELGAAGAPAAGTCCATPATECFGQRATNRAMQLGAGIDFVNNRGLRVHIAFTPELASQVSSPLVGDAYAERLGADLANIASQMALWAKEDPQGTQLATGATGRLLGMGPNQEYAGKLATYADPALPWRPATGGAAGDPRSQALLRLFHRAHAPEWCAAMDLDYLDALRARVAATATGTDPDAFNVATEICTEFAQRHARPWSSTAAIAQPFCGLAGDGSPVLLDKLGAGTYDAGYSWCTCGDGKLEATEKCDASAGDAGDAACPGKCQPKGHTKTIAGTAVLDECTCAEQCSENRAWQIYVDTGTPEMLGALPPACAQAMVTSVKDPGKPYDLYTNPTVFPKPSSVGCVTPSNDQTSVELLGIRRGELNPGGRFSDRHCDDVEAKIHISLGSASLGTSGSFPITTAWIRDSSPTGLFTGRGLSLMWLVKCSGATVYDNRSSYPYAWQVSAPGGVSEVDCEVHFNDPFPADRPPLWQRISVEGYGCAQTSPSGCVGIGAYAEVVPFLPKRPE